MGRGFDGFFALFCEERTRASSSGSSSFQRSPFQVDYDRILFSTPFRRLQDKTQVFPFPQRSGIHNRLTHSLEVASIGRSLATTVALLCYQQYQKQLKEKEILLLWMLPEVISAAGLAHDIGNPAFGHAGEDAIRSFFTSFIDAFPLPLSDGEKTDLLYYEGNANAIRLLTRHFHGKAPGGFGLTLTTLASLIKYPWESVALSHHSNLPKKFGFFQSEKNLVNRIFKAHSIDPIPEHPYLHYPRHPFVYLVEAADDICYLLIDLEDAFKLGIIAFTEVKELLTELSESLSMDKKRNKPEQMYKHVTDQNEQLAILRSQCIGELVTHIAHTFFHRFVINSDSYKEQPKSLIDAFQEEHSPFKQTWEAIKRFSHERIYSHEVVVKLQLAGYEVLQGLLARFLPAMLKEPKDRSLREKQLCSLIPVQFQGMALASPYEKIMAFLDFLSGMTDNYALRLYRNLTGMELPYLNETN